MNTERRNGEPLFPELPRDKRGYRKLTVMLPPDSYERLIRESVRRKIAGERDSQVSCMLRDAIARYFDKARRIQGS
jgi:hypothetical protein